MAQQSRALAALSEDTDSIFRSHIEAHNYNSGSGNLMPSSGLHRHQAYTHTVHRNTSTQTLVHIKKSVQASPFTLLMTHFISKDTQVKKKGK